MAARAKATARAKAAAKAKASAQARSAAQAKTSAPVRSGASAQSSHPAGGTRPAEASPQPAETGPAAGPGLAAEPKALLLAAAAQGIEAAALAVLAVLSAVSTADGRSHTRASGIAITLLVLLVAAGLATVAVSLAKARPWSRVPSALTQVFIIIVGIALMGGHPGWAGPALAVAVICLAGLLTPASLRALNRPLDQPPAKSR
jgi:hypothetical protein